MLSLSIIIPIYNVEKYLCQCLDSILVDNSFTGQVVCVNDGSTDNSLDILKQYKAKYLNVEIVSQPNSGLSEARNTGLRAAKADYVMFIDSDDWLFPNVLNSLIKQIQGEDILYFNGTRYFEEQCLYEKIYPIKEYQHIDGQSFFVQQSSQRRNIPWVCVWGAVYNRAFLIENNLWNEPGIYHEDSLFSPQALLAAHDVSSTDIQVYAYRIRSGSITAKIKPKNIKDALFVNRRLYAIYTTSQGIIEKVFYNYVMELYVGIIVDAGKSNIDLHQWWKKEDYAIMKHCVYNDRTRKIYKLSRISFSLSYKYCENKLPKYVRKLINRYL